MLTVSFDRFEVITFNQWYRYNFDIIINAIKAKDCNLLIVRFDKLKLAYVQLSISIHGY